MWVVLFLFVLRPFVSILQNHAKRETEAFKSLTTLPGETESWKSTYSEVLPKPTFPQLSYIL